MKTPEETPQFKVVMESVFQSYVHIFKDDKIWLGSVERTIAIEITTKLNERNYLTKEVERLKAQLETERREGRQEWERLQIEKIDRYREALEKAIPELKYLHEEVKRLAPGMYRVATTIRNCESALHP